jgi:uncharacterized protein (DUF1501 family)
MVTTHKPPTLVVLQLTGGNDPLNTVVPYGNPLYYDQRPTVHIREEQVLPIDEHYGFHPSMALLKPFWDQGKMAIINGIGYPRPDYSHFRSMDIWYTAQPETMATDGWLGKLVRDLDPQAENVLTAVSFGRGLPRALSLAGVPVASVAELDSYGLLTNLSSVAQRQAALEVFSWMYDASLETHRVSHRHRHTHRILQWVRCCTTWGRQASTPRKAPPFCVLRWSSTAPQSTIRKRPSARACAA